MPTDYYQWQTLIFLSLNRFYPVIFATHICRVARNTSSMTGQNISTKLRFPVTIRY